MFVLERQEMQSLGTEKALNADDSAFWNGCYLLEGIVDQNGFSKDIMTIHARLTPPKGGRILTLESSGSRANLAEVVNQLAARVTELLNVKIAEPQWNPSAEAAQYFDEANWALRWDAMSEAQAAIETSWTLGKRDLECARNRVLAYLDTLPEVLPPNQKNFKHTPGYRCVSIDQPPDPRDCNTAIRVLENYADFSRTAPESELRFFLRARSEWRQSDWDWYQLGIDVLNSSSATMRHFCFFPQAQKPVAEKLAELRSAARSVAAMIMESPSIHDTYYCAPDHIVPADEFDPHFMVWIAEGGMRFSHDQSPNIYRCAIKWGRYWQERPEDTIELYRQLMRSPLFSRVHGDFWDVKPDFPRLIAWNALDQNNIPRVWQQFVDSLKSSTNYFDRFEGNALDCADARAKVWAGRDPNVVGTAEQVEADQQWQESRGILLDFIATNYEAIIGNNCNLLENNWGVTALVGEKSEYSARFAAVQASYSSKADERLKEAKSSEAFAKQKQYLASFTPYDWNNFNKVFEYREYTRAQASQLRSLVVAYKSNLVAHTGSSRVEKFKADNNMDWIGSYLDAFIDKALRPQEAPLSRPTSAVPAATASAVSKPVATPVGAASNSDSGLLEETATNVLLVNQFLAIPLIGLPGSNISHVIITAHHWIEDKLLLDLQYDAAVYAYDTNGNWQGTRNTDFSAVALLDPMPGRWQVVSSGEVNAFSHSPFYHHTVLCHGELFTSNGGRLRKYDWARKNWQTLDLPGVDNCELFAIEGRLYAANRDLIVEIMDGGARTHVLASDRRTPAASTLDTENLGMPFLFAGRGQPLRAAIANKIVEWDGKDWRTICPAPNVAAAPDAAGDDVLFFGGGWNSAAGLWRLAAGSDQVELCLGQTAMRNVGTPFETGLSAQSPWKIRSMLRLDLLPATSRNSDLYLLADHAKAENIKNKQQIVVGQRVLPQNGYHADLLCVSSNDSTPRMIHLKFATDDSTVPVTGANSRAPVGLRVPMSSGGWLLFGSKNLYCGRETPNALPIAASPGYSGSEPPVAGIWKIPLADIDPELARQKSIQSDDRRLAPSQ
ncbi:MAG TPA: hypothetical protein VF988_04115 [Verrucomicrobiae bacterium]